MSAGAAKTADAAASAEGGDAPAPKKKVRNKKLIILVAAALAVVLLLGGGVAVILAKKKAEHAAVEEDDDLAAAEESAEHERKRAERMKKPPLYVPLDPFTVNLTDRGNERYAQIGVTLEIDDPHAGEQMKTVMPAIRNGILLILAHKSSQDLLDADGKEKLASEIMREAARPLGVEDENENPIRAVLFSSFIIQ